MKAPVAPFAAIFLIVLAMYSLAGASARPVSSQMPAPTSASIRPTPPDTDGFLLVMEWLKSNATDRSICYSLRDIYLQTCDDTSVWWPLFEPGCSEFKGAYVGMREHAQSRLRKEERDRSHSRTPIFKLLAPTDRRFDATSKTILSACTRRSFSWC